MDLNLKEERICRLCIKSVDSECHLLDDDDITMKMLDEISLTVDTTLSKCPILCEKCTDDIRRSYHFKTSCLNAETPIFSFYNESTKKFDGGDITVDENSGIVSQGLRLCQCCKDVRNSDCIATDILFRDPKFSQILLTLISKQALNITKNSFICTTCKQDLECYLNLARNCSEIKEKINTYRQGIDPMDTIKLTDIQNYLKHSPELNKIKQESNIMDYDSCGYSLDLDVIESKDRVTVKKEEEECSPGLETIEHQTDKTEVNETFECSICRTKLKTKKNLRCHEVRVHNLVRQRETKTRKHVCRTCGYIEESADALQTHLLSHNFTFQGEIYRCSNCAFEAPHKKFILDHMLAHSDVLDVTTYKCTLCPFRSFYEEAIGEHLATHKTKVLYKCERCEYETGIKSAFDDHMLSHTSTSGAYNCCKCSYKTMLKRYYDVHMLSHMDYSDVKILKCELCPFQTRYRQSFKKHKLFHEKHSGVILKCATCTYETVNKYDLDQHVGLTHGGVSKVKIYKCTNCPYETKDRRCLKFHALSHKEAPETEVFKCLNCPYETIRKRNLKQHMVMHMDDAKREIYECTTCDYTTKYKSDISRHQIVHAKDSEAQKFKCSLCDFESKWRSTVKNHLKTHAT